MYTRAFSDSEGEAEGAMIGRLVEKLMTETATADLHEHVATDKEQIVGCIFFSRLSFDPINAFLLSPDAETKTPRRPERCRSGSVGELL